MILNWTIFILWLVWSTFHGMNNAAGTKEFNLIADWFKVKDKHQIWKAERVLVSFILLMWITVTPSPFLIKFISTAIMGFVMMLSFSYFHNGMYYITRNRITEMMDNYTSYHGGWKHNKGANTREGIEIGYKFRVIMLVFAMVIMVFFTIYHKNII